MAWWYHFAVLFEALFILTTIDAGTRVGRFICQDLVGHAWPRFRQVSWPPAVLISSAVVAGGWGWLLYGGVIDKDGGVGALWPVFGMANQVLAAIALCVGTAVIVRMGKARFAFLTILPLIWLLAVTESAGWQLLASPSHKLSFIAKAHDLGQSLQQATSKGAEPSVIASLSHQRFNDYLDATLVALFMLVILVVVADTLRECLACLRHGRLRGSVPPAGAIQASAAAPA